MRRALVVVALLLASARPAGATSELDYVEHIFGVTNVNAVGGHGALTFGESADGDLTVLSWPSPGFDDQIAYLTSNDIDGRSLVHDGAPDGMGSYLGLIVDTGGGPQLTWLRDATTWTAAQAYSQPDSVVPVTTFTSASLGLTVTVTDVVSPDVDVLTRHVRVVRAPGSPVVSASLAVYENLSPSLSRIPQIPIGDWALDAHNDFLAVWDQTTHGIVHFHPGDREVFLTLVDLINLTADVDFGPVEDLMKQAPPSATAVADFVAGLDTAYTPGVAAIVTTEPAPSGYQVGADATPICALVDQMVDNVLALPMIYPTVNVPLSPDSAEILRCTDQLPRFATDHGWTWQPQDALADLADGTLSGSPVAAAQTNGALIAPLTFAPDGGDDAATGSMVIAFGDTLAAARTALAGAKAHPFADRLAAAEAASHDALAGAPLPDPALGDRVVAVAQRALANIYVARDRGTGAFLAAVTRQPPYALDWPRDGAFLSLAADLAGRTDWVTQRDTWYATVQRRKPAAGSPLLQPDVPTDPDTGKMDFPADAWEMNYYVDGEPGGPIRFEIDNTALHVWSTAVHAAMLTGADRDAFVAAVWPTDRDALDLLVRWKEADTDLPAAANEDDNLALTSTLHGAVAVYTGLVAGARLAHAAGDDDRGRTYLARADALRAAIDQAYYDPDTGSFRAARGLPGGPHDSIAGWDTGWLVWPARFFDANDPRQEAQLSSDMDGILAILRGETLPGGTYTAKNVLSAALYGQPGGSRDQAAQAVALLAGIATPGTDSFGEVYMPEPDGAGGITWSNRTATPHVWEGALFYLSAMALTRPELFNADEAELPLPPAAGCGCTSARPSDAAGPLGIVLVVGLGRRRRRRRRRMA